MVVADTCFIIDLLKGEKKAAGLLRDIESRNEQITVSTVTVYELAAGYPAGLSDARKKMLRTTKIVEFSFEQAELGGKTESELIESGEEIGTVDCMIAAVAIQKNEKLITRNSKHFKRIKGLELLEY